MGYVADFPLNTNTIDTTHGNTMTETGTINYLAGPGIWFDGTQSLVTVSPYKLGYKFSVEIWSRFLETLGNAETLWSLYSGTAGYHLQVNIVDDLRELQAYVFDNTVATPRYMYNAETRELSNDRWYLLLVTVSYTPDTGTAKACLYINHEKEKCSDELDKGLIAYPAVNFTPTHDDYWASVGAEKDASAPFTGFLARFGVWQDEIRADYVGLTT